MKYKDISLLLIPFLGFFTGSIVINMFGNPIQSIMGTIALMYTWVSIIYFCVLLLIFRKLEGKFLLQAIFGFGIPFVFMILINKL